MNSLQPSFNQLPEIPYRARYQANFDGSQALLEHLLEQLLDELDATYLDDLEDRVRFNPIERRYELEAVLNQEVEFSLLAYWSAEEQHSIKITIDLDSPISIEISIEGLFFNTAQQYLPNIQLIFNFLTKPKVISKRLPPRTDILANHEWIKEHRQQYQGRWVALRNGELLAEGESSDEVRQKVVRSKDTLLTVIY